MSTLSSLGESCDSSRCALAKDRSSLQVSELGESRLLLGSGSWRTWSGRDSGGSGGGRGRTVPIGEGLWRFRLGMSALPGGGVAS